MFGQVRLFRMKPTSYLINTARGGIIDEPALHSALTRGAIRGAALDVFDREPPDSHNPLLSLPNVLLAPHMAGVTQESVERTAVAVAENILSALDGKPTMDNVVNHAVFKHR
jgi:D-3-phosphoglycerate dehydrogenase